MKNYELAVFLTQLLFLREKKYGKFFLFVLDFEYKYTHCQWGFILWVTYKNGYILYFVSLIKSLDIKMGVLQLG